MRETAATHQRLVAILAADAAGYSRLMTIDEAGTLAALDAARAVFRERIEAHRGRVVDMAGDSVLAVFETAAGAVGAALAIQAQLATLAAAASADSRMQFRIGVHLGDVMEKSDGSVYGDGVNIAARLEGLALPGGVTVSDAVHGAVRYRIQATFEDIGEQRVKNIADGIRAYRAHGVAANSRSRPASRWMSARGLVPRYWPRAPLVPIAAAMMAAALVGFAVYYAGDRRVGSVETAPSSRSALNPLSVIVLPFSLISSDSTKGYVADALTSSIAADLSRIRDAFVVPATTSYTYKGRALSASQIGREAGVRFVLSGDVLLKGDAVRVQAQLSDSFSGGQVWAESFDGDLSDLFRLQDQVTTRVALSIGREMTIVAARDSVKQKRTPQAADLLLRTRALLLRIDSLQASREAEAMLRQALVLEPDNVDAMVALADVLSLRHINWRSNLSAEEDARTTAEADQLSVRAQALDPRHPDVYWPLATALGRRGQREEAVQALQRALELNPSNPRAYNELGLALSAQDPDRAIRLLKQGMALDPRRPGRSFPLNLSTAYWAKGDFAEALAWAKHCAEESPGFPYCHEAMALAYAELGQTSKARAAAAELLRLTPDYRTLVDNAPPKADAPEWERTFHQRTLEAARRAGLPD